MDNEGGRSAIRLTVRQMSEWTVPGYEALELLGFGASGELWRARERASGELVALRRITGGDREAVARVRRDALAVRSVASYHLVRLRGVLRAGPDDVLVLDYAAGGSLRSLLRRRGALEPGEVVTAVAPIAEALGQAHAQGLVHGRVTASAVLLTADGRPLLDGLGRSWLVDPVDLVAPVDPGDPAGGLGCAADVWALGALAQLLLTGREVAAGVPTGSVAPTAPPLLVRAVESALSVDPTARPTSLDLAATLLAACPALPLHAVLLATPNAVTGAGPNAVTGAGPNAVTAAGPNAVVAPGRAAPWWPRPRTSLLGGVALLALGLVSAAGWVWGQSDDPQPGTSSSPSMTLPQQPNWTAVLEGLDDARGRAFAAADRAVLAEVYVSGSDLWRADAATVADLVRTGRTAVGVAHARASVTPISVAADRVELRVVEALTAYDVLGVAGRVLERRPSGATSTRVLVLVRAAGGWRLAAVLT